MLLAILHECMVFRVVLEREVVHSGILPRLVSDLRAFEKPLGIVRLHLFREYPKVEQGPKPLHRMTLVLGFFGDSLVNKAYEAFRQQDGLPAQIDSYDSKSLVNNDMSVSYKQKEDSDLLHSLCPN